MATTEEDQEPKLHPQMIEEIAVRLPAKSLARFKSVSKSWLQMISDPFFARQNLTHTKTLQILFASNRAVYSSNPKSLNKQCCLILSNRIKDYPFNTQSDSYPKGWIQFVGSANGLMCISPPPVGSYTFFIYNPTTGDYKQIPDDQIVPSPHPDKFSATPYFGFGYCPLSNDYKFVKVALGRIVLVYSLKNNKWKTLSEEYSYNPWWFLPPFNYMPGTQLNGSIHWIQSRGNLQNNRWLIYVKYVTNEEEEVNIFQSSENLKLPYSCVIAAFNLKKEKFVDIPMPNPDMDFRKFDLGVLGEKLCLMHYNGKHNEFWVMNEYGVRESWNKIVLSLSYHDLRPICFAEDGDNKGALMVINQDRLVMVNIHGSCVHLRVKKMRGKKFESDVLVESLVSPSNI